MIESIWLKNFRKHRNVKITFDGRFNIITGKNNAGKTSIFYAIEYCLFGLPAGFKRVSQLATFGTNDVGVQLVFTTRTGERYRLQRMHAIEPAAGKGARARKVTTPVRGAFTLKQLLPPSQDAEVQETYTLVSEHGDREEQLSLKISELLGFSKRSFHEAVSFSQGEIASVLQGPRNLDIVLGLNAAAALGDAFGSRALEFKKECAEADRVSLQLEQAITDKKDTERAITDGERKVATLRAAIDQATRQLEHLATIKNDHAVLASHLEQWERIQARGREQAGKAGTLEAQLADLGTRLGPLDALQAALDGVTSNLATDIANRDASIQQAEAKLQAARERLRAAEREKGDIAGVLRRRAQAKGAPSCEYCGAPVDPATIGAEIATLEAAMATLDGRIRALEDEVAATGAGVKASTAALQAAAQQARLVEGTAGKLRAALGSLPAAVHRGFTGTAMPAGSLVDRLQDVNAWLASAMSVHEQLVAATLDATDQAAREAHAVEAARAAANTTMNRYDPARGTWLDEPPVNDESKRGLMDGIHAIVTAVGMDTSDVDMSAIARFKAELHSFTVAKGSELATLAGANRRQLDEQLAALEQAKRRVLTVDKTIASLAARAEELARKQRLATRYASFKKVFSDIQARIRETAAGSLQRSILEFHQALSPDREFTAVKIDPNDYSLHVQPAASGTGEFYPAALYEGGGHKLILGLAYKLALGKLIGTPPFLLIDEPTEFMDAGNKRAMMASIPVLAKDSQVLLVTHQDAELPPAGRTIRLAPAGDEGVAGR